MKPEQLRHGRRKSGKSNIFTPPLITTEDVIRKLLAQGVPEDQILIFGLGKNDVLFMPDNFSDLLDEFEDQV